MRRRSLPLDELTALGPGDLLYEHMREPFDEQTLANAQAVFTSQIGAGEKILAYLSRKLARDLLGTTRLQNKGSVVKHDFLSFLFRERPESLEPRLQALTGRHADLIAAYPRLRQEDDPLTKVILSRKDYLEIFYTREAYHERDTALVQVRRKDTDRAIEKIAGRMMLARYKPSSIDRNQRIAVDDFFGVKATAYRREDVRDVFERVMQVTQALGYQIPCEYLLAQLDDEGNIVAHDDRSVEDLYPYGKAHVIQAKRTAPTPQGNLLVEIDVSDVIGNLIDEMDHVQRYEVRRRRIVEEVIKASARNKREYKELVRRGNELAVGLPKRRRKIIGERKYFQ